MRALIFATCLLAACATSAPQPAPTTFDEVPAAALNAMCLRLHDEGMATDAPVDVISTSRPLVTERALAAIAAESAFRGHASRAALDRAFAANATPLKLATTNACALTPIAASKRLPSDTMLLELSAPFIDPFGRGNAGVIARLSLAGEAATWYWIPLVSRNGAWLAGQPVSLGLRD